MILTAWSCAWALLKAKQKAVRGLQTQQFPLRTLPALHITVSAEQIRNGSIQGHLEHDRRGQPVQQNPDKSWNSCPGTVARV